ARPSSGKVAVVPAPAPAPASAGPSAWPLMSPRESAFTGRLFRPPLTGVVLGFPAGLFGDPRSPVQRGESGIVRSIFDVL
ncbi:MAG: hypothetical protein M1826_005555, partial [Phylliscum demangeonii]